MFQMNCSSCGELIHSPQLVELQVVKCPQCEKVVEIKNVVMSNHKLSVGLRSSLKKMLLTAGDKFRVNKSQVMDAKTKYAIDKRLAKLLRRDDFRLDMSYDLYVQVNYGSYKRLAKLLNISSEGAGIEFADRSRQKSKAADNGPPLPEDNSEVSLLLPLPGDAQPLSLRGRVVWSKVPGKETLFPSIPMGVKFKDVDEGIRASLWDFIVETETSSKV